MKLNLCWLGLENPYSFSGYCLSLCVLEVLLHVSIWTIIDWAGTGVPTLLLPTPRTVRIRKRKQMKKRNVIRRLKPFQHRVFHHSDTESIYQLRYQHLLNGNLTQMYFNVLRGTSVIRETIQTRVVHGTTIQQFGCGIICLCVFSLVQHGHLQDLGLNPSFPKKNLQKESPKMTQAPNEKYFTHSLLCEGFNSG